MTPTAFLAERLSELDVEGLLNVAEKSGVEIKTARRAAAGEPIKASDALRLYAARGYDPIGFEQIERKTIGPFNHQTLALFLNGHMRVARLRVRSVAAAAKLSPTAVQHILDAKPVSIGSIVKACRYLGINPFSCCDQVKVREAA